MGLFKPPKPPKPPAPVIAPPQAFQPQPAQVARPRQATNASLDSRISAPNQSGRINILAPPSTQRRTLFGG